MTTRLRLLLPVLLVAGLVSPIAGAGAGTAQAACGVERWSVKTGTDPDASLIDLTATTHTSVAQLTSLTPPATLPPDNRIQPTETTVFELDATLIGFVKEDDQDYHAVLQDAGQTMIAELPDPACVGASSPLLPGITNARSQFDAQYTATSSFQTVNASVTVRGVGFFDELHGQTGVAPNGIELHPVLDIAFGASPPPTTSGDLFTALDPTRLLDTRSGIGAPRARVGPGGIVNLRVAGVSGVPVDAHAVTLNVTGVLPTANTNVSVYPASAAGTLPATSNLNLPPGAAIANQVVVKVGENGDIRLRNAAGSIDLLADLAGYYAGGAETTYAPGSPTRILDTRSGLGAPRVKLGPGGVVDLQVQGVAGVPADATAVVMNVTATGTTTGTDIRAYPTPSAGAAVPTVSSLNVRAGQTIANLVTVRIGAAGKIRLRNAAGSVDLLADVAGYFSPDLAGSTYTALDPVRLLDTRSGLGEAGGAGPEGPGGLIDLQLTGSAGMPADATAAVVNLTGISPTVSTDLRAYPTPDAGFPLPTVSNVNLSPGQVLPNLVAVAIGAGGRVRLRNAAGGVHLVADLSGYYTAPGAPDHGPPPPTPRPQGVTASASMSNARPVQNTTVYVNVATTPGASVTASAYFRTGTVSHSATANSAGSVAIAFAVGSAPAGYAVPVRVSAYDPEYKATAYASTSFTPVAPPPPPPPPGHAVVSLGTIQYDPPGADTGSNINQEYVTVRNTGTVAQPMGGWTLRDASGHVYTFPAVTLAAGRYFIVHTGSGSYNGTDLYWGSGAYIWNNDGDTAYLRTNTGTAVDTCAWTTDGSGLISC
jgi:hypothetical protein